MRVSLTLHPDCRCDAVARVDVEVARRAPGALDLRYIVEGAIPDLSFSEPSASLRADELWEDTCLEAFLRSADDGAYWEFNFSPSTQWAAYTFDGYRAGMRELINVTPRVEVRADASRLELHASLAGIPAPVSTRTWHLGISAVIEEKSGRKSYWAYAHAPGPPDFHREACFALELPPPERS